MLSLLIPYSGAEIILTEVTVGGSIVFIVFAYTLGLMTQALGGTIHSSEDDFIERMRRVTEGTKDGEASDVKPTDIQFVESVRAEFDLDASYNDWESIYRLVLAKLETTSRSRSIRLQALFLAMRGFTVCGIVLIMAYTALLVLISFDLAEAAASTGTLLVLLPLAIVLTFLSWSRGAEFSEDVISYMILEYTLERNNT
ncbi:hypothetical protein BB347_00055 [Natronorubrum daqingense]|uniref:Uncharacterized protein n=1 Tax=Natronorubrum daqingense TaxID=588898 RepID=A0A1P8R8V4_9EURY|nr:hypothetical protein BB347_00055 [Natronorubrum daqingense]